MTRAAITRPATARSGFLAEVAEGLGVMAAMVLFGLLWAAVEGRALGAYPGAVVESGPQASPALPEASLWLVDGYNVLHAGLMPPGSRRGWWSAEHRERVVATAGRFLEARPGVEVWVVFDGPRAEEAGALEPTAQPASGVRSVFAPSADDWLIAQLRKSPPETVAIVTADRQLAARARHKGASIVRPRVFLAACGAG